MTPEAWGCFGPRPWHGRRRGKTTDVSAHNEASQVRPQRDRLQPEARGDGLTVERADPPDPCRCRREAQALRGKVLHCGKLEPPHVGTYRKQKVRTPHLPFDMHKDSVHSGGVRHAPRGLACTTLSELCQARKAYRQGGSKPMADSEAGSSTSNLTLRYPPLLILPCHV